MATTEALSRELIAELARLASAPVYVVTDTQVSAGDTIVVCGGYDIPLVILYRAGFIAVDPIPPQSGKIVLTEKGWAALKEHADAQGDL